MAEQVDSFRVMHLLIVTGAFILRKMPCIGRCKEGQSKPASIVVGDQGSQHVQQDPVQGAEGGEPGELDRVPLQLVHCPCHDHTWGQGFDPLTGCPFSTLILFLLFYNKKKNRSTTHIKRNLI